MDLKKYIVESIKINEISKEELYSNLEKPKDQNNGDFSIPCFKFSKIFKKPPVVIADYILSNTDKNKYIQKIENVNGFLNFKLNKDLIVDDIINEIYDKREMYGTDNSGENKTVCIDYSSVNIAKRFHIGHLLSTVIGSALYKIYKYLGYKTIGINHLGDWGTQFGCLICAYKKWGSDEEIKKDGIDALTRYYVKFHKEEEKEKEEIFKKMNIKDDKIITPLREEAKNWFKKIEENDSEAIQIFNLFKQITLDEVQKIYNVLSVDFDSYKGESFYNDKMQPVINELKEKNLLKESQGVQIVEFLDEKNNEILSPAIIQKSDGTSLYITRDLAAAFYRKNTYNFNKMLYVVGNQQILHFKQLFEVIKLLGYDWYNEMEHVQFGLVSLEEGAMSSRKGNVVLLEDVIKTSIEKSLKIISEKNPNLSNKEDVAKKIGVGAVIFSAVKNSRIKDIVFSYDKMLNFEGETAPYIQYTYVRCLSILRKANINLNQKLSNYNSIKTDVGLDLIFKLSDFNETLKNVINKQEPFILSRYLIDIAKLFNKFYNETKIITDNKEETIEKLYLVKSVATILKKGLNLLGIECPEEM